MATPLISALVLIVSTLQIVICAEFQVLTSFEGGFKVVVQNHTWLNSSSVFFHADNCVYTTSDGTLVLLRAKKDAGIDVIGRWKSMIYAYKTWNSSLMFETEIRAYSDAEVVTFGQVSALPMLCSSPKFLTQEGKLSKLIGWFSLFSSEVFARYSWNLCWLCWQSVVRLSYFQCSWERVRAHFGLLCSCRLHGWGWQQRIWEVGVLNSCYSVTSLFIQLHLNDWHWFNDCLRWNTNDLKLLRGHVTGPISLYDGQGNALVISHLTNFMGASLWYDKGTKSVSYGALGKAEAIPRGFDIWTIISYSSSGVNKVICLLFLLII